MLLFRSLTVGLLAACAVLLADLPAVHTHTIETVRVADPPVRTNRVTVVDIAPGVQPWSIYPLLRLSPDETIVAIGDRRTGTFAAISDLVDAVDMGARFLDLTVARHDKTRRVLVLLH